MHFLRTLFWVILAVALLIFSAQNNRVVTVKLWGGLEADVRLWLLVIGPFILGFLPTWIFHRISLWQERRHAKVAGQRAADLASYDTRTSISPDGTMVSHPTHPQVSPTL